MSQHVPGRAAKTGPIRIGDVERDDAVAMLSEHFVAGRLTQDEFEERSDQATQARYTDDLTSLFADLPDTTAAARPVPRTWSPGLRAGSPPFRTDRPRLGWLVPMLMVGLVIAAVVLTAPWILWVLFCIALFSGLRNHRHRHWHHPPSVSGCSTGSQPTGPWYDGGSGTGSR